MHWTSWIVGLIAGSVLSACSGKPSVGTHSTHPDKVLFDRAKDSVRQKRFELANLELQTLLNTYPTSQYAAEAKSLLHDPANCGQFNTTPEQCNGNAQARPSR